MFDSFFYKSPIDAHTLRQTLNDVITPRLANRGLDWNGKYLWFSQPSNSIRNVFEYNKLKGETGTFTWGVCFDFIPTLSSNRLIFHRTDKSVKPLLFEWTEEYSNSFFGGNIAEGITSHWGKKESKKSIMKLFDKYETKINNWFDNASTFENLLKIAQRQIEIGKSYNLHNPNPKLIIAFLQAKIHQFDKATRTINELVVDENLKRLLFNQIDKIR